MNIANFVIFCAERQLPEHTSSYLDTAFFRGLMPYSPSKSSFWRPFRRCFWTVNRAAVQVLVLILARPMSTINTLECWIGNTFRPRLMFDRYCFWFIFNTQKNVVFDRAENFSLLWANYGSCQSKPHYIFIQWRVPITLSLLGHVIVTRHCIKNKVRLILITKVT